jgi:hypothetical protein
LPTGSCSAVVLAVRARLWELLEVRVRLWIGGGILTDEIAFAIAEFFDQVGPSHDVITTLVARSGLTRFDPAANSTDIVGKKRRLRVVLTRARV